MANVRFQKRIRLLPFLWLNLSKTGTSLTLGCRFLKINFGKRGIWLTGSLTGTGLSVRHQLKKPNSDKPTLKQKAQSSGSTEKPKRKCVVSTPSSKRDPDMYSDFIGEHHHPLFIPPFAQDKSTDTIRREQSGFYQQHLMEHCLDDAPVTSFGSHTRKHCDDTPATSHNHDSGSSDHHHSYNHCNDNDSPAASHSYDSCNNDSNDTCNYDY